MRAGSICVSVRSTNSRPTCSASARTRSASLIMPRSINTRPRAFGCLLMLLEGSVELLGRDEAELDQDLPELLRLPLHGRHRRSVRSRSAARMDLANGATCLLRHPPWGPEGGRRTLSRAGSGRPPTRPPCLSGRSGGSFSGSEGSSPASTPGSAGAGSAIRSGVRWTPEPVRPASTSGAVDADPYEAVASAGAPARSPQTERIAGQAPRRSAVPACAC